MAPITQPPVPTPRKPRALILAFDGTAGEFSGHNSNVVKLCAVIQMKDYEKQMVYYQPGIGTYTNPGILGNIQKWIAKTADLAVAWYLDAHIESGYEFLMENHLPGDKIFLFGWSRGAYTARALASMLYAVGLLPKGNQEQIPFAYSMYKAQNKTVADRFKGAFCKEVEIEMMGVWDTVASVGAIIPQTLPITSHKTIKYFRHGVALDEHRVRFGVVLWQKEEEMTGLEADPNGPQRVLEMFFVGCHADVGGGNELDEAKTSLSNVPLRWMLHEIQNLCPDILFDQKTLDDLKIPTTCVVRDPFSDLAQTPAASEGNGSGPNTSPPVNAPIVVPIIGATPENSTPQPTQNGTAKPGIEPLPAKPSSQTTAQATDPTGKGPLSNLSSIFKNPFFGWKPFSWRLPQPTGTGGDVTATTADIPTWKQQDNDDVQAPIYDEMKRNILWWLVQWSWTGYQPKFNGRRSFPTEDPQGAKDSIRLIHPSVLTRKKDMGYVPYTTLPPNWEEFRVAAEVG